DTPALKAAQHLLDKVAQGNKPEPDLYSKLGVQSQKNLEWIQSSNPAKTPDDLKKIQADSVRAVQEEFEKDSKRVEKLTKAGKEVDPPPLRERINNPKSEEDRALAKLTKTSMDRDSYDKYMKPLLETGKLPLDKQMELNKRTLSSNDAAGTMKDLE